MNGEARAEQQPGDCRPRGGTRGTELFAVAVERARMPTAFGGNGKVAWLRRAHEERHDRVWGHGPGPALCSMALVRLLPFDVPHVLAAEQVWCPVQRERAGLRADRLANPVVAHAPEHQVLAIPPCQHPAPAHVVLKRDDFWAVEILVAEEAAQAP